MSTPPVRWTLFIGDVDSLSGIFARAIKNQHGLYRKENFESLAYSVQRELFDRKLRQLPRTHDCIRSPSAAHSPLTTIRDNEPIHPRPIWAQCSPTTSSPPGAGALQLSWADTAKAAPRSSCVEFDARCVPGGQSEPSPVNHGCGQAVEVDTKTIVGSANFVSGRVGGAQRLCYRTHQNQTLA